MLAQQVPTINPLLLWRGVKKAADCPMNSRGSIRFRFDRLARRQSIRLLHQAGGHFSCRLLRECKAGLCLSLRVENHNDERPVRWARSQHPFPGYPDVDAFGILDRDRVRHFGLRLRRVGRRCGLARALQFLQVRNESVERLNRQSVRSKEGCPL
jgi:hypothetical protein